MTNEKFNKIVEYVKETLITQTLIIKGNEYTRDGDRLSNFKRMAAALKCTPERALIGAAMKHFASIFDMVDDIDSGRIPELLASLDQWDEKLGDAINYLILLRALVEERNGNIPEQGIDDNDYVEGR